MEREESEKQKRKMNEMKKRKKRDKNWLKQNKQSKLAETGVSTKVCVCAEYTAEGKYQCVRVCVCERDTCHLRTIRPFF